MPCGLFETFTVEAKYQVFIVKLNVAHQCCALQCIDFLRGASISTPHVINVAESQIQHWSDPTKCLNQLDKTYKLSQVPAEKNVLPDTASGLEPLVFLLPLGRRRRWWKIWPARRGPCWNRLTQEMWISFLTLRLPFVASKVIVSLTTYWLKTLACWLLGIQQK